MKQKRGFQINYHRGFLDTPKPKGRVKKGKWGEDIDYPVQPVLQKPEFVGKDDYVGKFSDYI